MSTNAHLVTLTTSDIVDILALIDTTSPHLDAAAQERLRELSNSILRQVIVIAEKRAIAEKRLSRIDQATSQKPPGQPE